MYSALPTSATMGGRRHFLMEPLWEAWAPACLLGLRVPTPIKPDIQPKYTHIPKYGFVKIQNSKRRLLSEI